MHRLEIRKENRFWKYGWTNLVVSTLQERELTITRPVYSTPLPTGNRAVIDFAIEFVNGKTGKERIKILQDINYIKIIHF